MPVAPPRGTGGKLQPEAVTVGGVLNGRGVWGETQLPSERERAGSGEGGKDGERAETRMRVRSDPPELVARERAVHGGRSWVVGGEGRCTAQWVRQKQEQRSTRPW